jgi:hypothetical protein
MRKHNDTSATSCILTIIYSDSNTGRRDVPLGAEPGTAKLNKDVPITQIVSNARGPYPQLEMVSVPHTRNRSTIGRHSSVRTTGPEAEGAAIQKITRRLADVRIVDPNLLFKADSPDRWDL